MAKRDPFEPLAKRDDDFYFIDIVLQVENKLFRFPRKHLTRESEVFSQMFKTIPLDAREGLVDDNPMWIPDVKSQDFKQLLRVLCPYFDPENTLTLDEWVSVLHMSDRFICERVRHCAIVKLAPLIEENPSFKYHLAKRYDIVDWKLPALNMLAQRAKPMGMDDVKLLGEDTVLMIAAMRERGIHEGFSERGEVCLNFEEKVCNAFCLS